MINFSNLEINAINESDVVIIVLPAGRGTHVELGYSLACNKKIIVCSLNEDVFSLENTVNFYELPCLERIVGDKDEIVRRILK